MDWHEWLGNIVNNTPLFVAYSLDDYNFVIH